MRKFSLQGRNGEILVATVRAYIASGEPVGSRTISRRRREVLSAATIRNVMADLEAEGYLEQPHTSAGRVPTEKAYRFYAEEVARPQHHLNPSDEELIRQQMWQGAAEGPQALLERASHVLSLVTHNLGVVVSATSADLVLRNIQFVSLSEGRVLVLLLPRSAPLRSRVIRLDETFSQEELNRIANYLNANFSGWRLEEARREIQRRLEQERARYDELLRHLAALWRQGILEAAADTAIYLEGASNLMGRPELHTAQALRGLLRALEEKQRLVHLLLRYLQADDVPADQPARVVIGLDTEPPLRHFALIGALCHTPQGLAGRVAVLGPPRMQYERVISAVSQVARLVGQALGEA